MATQAIRAVEIALGSPFWSWENEEAATQTYLRGAVVIYSAGYVQEASTDPADILGIALRAGQNGDAAGDKRANFVPLLPGTVIEANLAQAAANTVSAATDVGKAYGLVKRTSGTAHWVIDSAETSSTRCRIIGFVGGKPKVGDTNARVYAVVFAANLDFAAA